jgi:hypothetical protein
MAKTRATPAAEPAAAPKAQYFAPDDVSSIAPTARYLGGESAHYLYHRPGRYQLMAGRVVPSLSKLGRVGGLNDVAAVRQRTPGGWRYVPDMSRAIAKLQRDGCQIVPFDVDADEGFPSYLQAIPGTGRYCHRLCELVPGIEPVPPGPAAFADWLASLVARGVVPAPHPSQVAALLKKKTALAQQLTRGGKPEQGAALLEEVARARVAAAPPKPKPKRTRKAKPKPKAIEVDTVLEVGDDG